MFQRGLFHFKSACGVTAGGFVAHLHSRTHMRAAPIIAFAYLHDLLLTGLPWR